MAEINEQRDCLFTNTHEYVCKKDDHYLIGISRYATEQLGDVVFVELPEAGSEFSKLDVFATVESVKAASEVYMPIGGKVIEVNEALTDSPELLNEDPYEKGWFVKVSSDSFQEDSLGLLTHDEYISAIG